MNSKIVVPAVIVGVCCVVGFGYGLLQSTGSSDVPAMRAAMKSGMTQQCVPAARAQAPSNIGDDQISGYCTCAATRLDAALTDDDIRQMAEITRKQGTQAMAGTVMPKLSPIMAACRAENKLPS